MSDVNEVNAEGGGDGGRFLPDVLGYDDMRESREASLMARAHKCIGNRKDMCRKIVEKNWANLAQIQGQTGGASLSAELEAVKNKIIESQRALTQERAHWAAQILQGLVEKTASNKSPDYVAQPTYAPTPRVELVTMEVEGQRKAWDRELCMELEKMPFSYPKNDAEVSTFLKLLHDRVAMQLRMKEATMERMSDTKRRMIKFGPHPDYMFQSLLLVKNALEEMHNMHARETGGRGVQAKPGSEARPHALAYKWRDPTNESVDLLTGTDVEWQTKAGANILVEVPWGVDRKQFRMQAMVRVVVPTLRSTQIPFANNEETMAFVNDEVFHKLGGLPVTEVEIELTDLRDNSVDRYRFRVERYAGKGATLLHPFVATQDESTVGDVNDFRKRTYEVKTLPVAALHGKPGEASMMASILTYVYQNSFIQDWKKTLEAVTENYLPDLNRMRVYYHWEDRHRNGRMVWLLHVGKYVLGAYVYSPHTEHVWFERNMPAVHRRPSEGAGGRQGHGHHGHSFNPQIRPFIPGTMPMPYAAVVRGPPHPGSYGNYRPPHTEPYGSRSGRPPALVIVHGPQRAPSRPPSANRSDPRASRPPSQASSAQEGPAQAQSASENEAAPPEESASAAPSAAPGGRGGGFRGGGGRGGRGRGPVPRPPPNDGGGWSVVPSKRGRGRGAPASAPRSAYPLPPQPRRLATSMRAEAPWQAPEEDPMRAVLADLAAIKRSLNDAQVLKDVLCG